MKLVIDIPDWYYNELQEFKHPNFVDKAISDGIILPKHHGDLVDRDAINDRFYGIWKELESCSNKPSHKELLDKWSMCMDTAPTIIEADEESKHAE